MRNKNVLIGVALAAAIVLVAVLAAILPSRVAAPAEDAPTLAPMTAASEAPESSEAAAAAATATPAATATATAAGDATATPAATATASATATNTPAVTASATPETTAAETDTPAAAATATPAVTAGGAAAEPSASAAPEATFDPSSVKAWLLVTVGNVTYQPIPLLEEGEYSVTQESGAKNVIYVTEESVAMKSSTCDNQDCVQQGTITLSNMDSRLLGNMIICLPNQVSLELYTTEELIELLSAE